jgi:hypothetical protein
LCAIIKGDLECSSLFVGGESLLACFGTCTSEYIRSNYNGVFSSIRRALTEYVILSSDEMLQIHEAGNDLLCLEEKLELLLDSELLRSEVAEAEECLDTFLEYLRHDKNPFVDELSFAQVMEKVADAAQIKQGDEVGLR